MPQRLSYILVAHRVPVLAQPGDVLDRRAAQRPALEEPAAAEHRVLDRVIVHGVASMSSLTLGDVEATWRHVRDGVELATAVRLPVSLAQFTWGEYALRVWEADDLDSRTLGQRGRRRRAA